MIKQTRKPIQLTKSMLINILRDMEVSFLSAAITLSSNLKITGYENT